jgi:hypothetical protein
MIFELYLVIIMSNNKENKKIGSVTALVIAVLLIAVIILTSILIFRKPTEQGLPQPQQPVTSDLSLKAPSNLTNSTITATEVNLIWQDNSESEHGFRLYRDGVVIANLPENTSIYKDMNLKPATDYSYKVEAYYVNDNVFSLDCKIKTLNPPINIWIDKIGVHDNGEDFLRGDTGEVNIAVVISDNKSTVQTRLPANDYYHLKQDESVQVNQKVFSTSEVGDNLRISIIGYENDTGDGAQFMYKVMGLVIESFLWSPLSVFLGLAGIDLGDIISKLFGGENDWLGTHVVEYTVSDNWGVGKHTDVLCKNKKGETGLIFSFRIECPVYDYFAGQ